MTTAPTLPQTEPRMHFVLHGVSWQLYEMLLKETEEQRIFISYDRGELELMAPSPYHERYKKLPARFIEAMTLELDIPIVSGGSTTFRREDLEKGLEPDECYYVQHEAEVRDRWTVDLRQDPPPDLAIEMNYTHHALDREKIYAALGVPELWRFDLRRLEFLALRPDSSYEQREQSVAFPFLQRADIERFLLMRSTTDETALMRIFRDRVRANLRKS